jgi:hypothetical protein
MVGSVVGDDRPTLVCGMRYGMTAVVSAGVVAVIAAVWQQFATRGHEGGQIHGTLGRVPSELDLLDRRGFALMVSRRGQAVTGQFTSVDLESGRFSVRVPGGEPVDIQLYWLPLGTWTGQSDRHILTLGGFEAYARGIHPGESGVQLDIHPVVLEGMEVQVFGPAGESVGGGQVWLSSMVDWVRGPVRADGRGAIAGLPVREWELVVHPPTGRVDLLSSEARTVVPGSDVIQVTLRNRDRSSGDSNSGPRGG